jgi:hypothetical protein
MFLPDHRFYEIQPLLSFIQYICDLVNGFLRCALAFCYNVSAVFGDFAGEIGFSEAFLHCLEQFLPVSYENRALAFEQIVDGLLEIEGVWAEDGGLCEGSDLNHVGAAHWYEGAADEDYGGK